VLFVVASKLEKRYICFDEDLAAEPHVLSTDRKIFTSRYQPSCVFALQE
jgi:hypothetical protein